MSALRDSLAARCTSLASTCTTMATTIANPALTNGNAFRAFRTELETQLDAMGRELAAAIAEEQPDMRKTDAERGG